MSRSRRSFWLCAIIAVEALLFLWKCNHFFNGDSLFFFSHEIRSWTDIGRVFKGPDHLWQYRPLTFVIFSFFLKPLFGLNPLGYNIFPLLVHAANTLLIFGILGRLGATERAALLGAFFFGTHSTAFYVTYGVAFLPDFSYSFFYLLSVFFFARYLSSGARINLTLSIPCFLLALFCKEAAVTLVPVVLAAAFFWGKQGFRMPQESPVRAANVALRRTLPFLIIGAAYLTFHWIAKAGQIYAPGAAHPHHSEFSFYALHMKYKYLKWSFNLPDGLVFNFEGWVNYLIALALLFFAIPFVLSTIRRLWTRDRLAWFGCIWFLVALSPVLFLRNLTMNHNLYVPLAGLSLVFGDWLDRVLERMACVSRAWARATVSAFILIFVAAVFFHNLRAVKDSWIAAASSIAETSLRDLKRQRPTLPNGATLYIVDKSSLGGLQWYYDYGSLFRLFYPARALDIQFINPGGTLPGRNEMPRGAIILEYDGSHLAEVRGEI